MIGIITTVQMIGSTVGVSLGGQMADTIGRKKTLFITYVLMLAFHLISAFSVSVEMYAVLRFLAGIAVGAAMVTALVIPVEYVGAEWRAYTNLPLWSVGTMLLAGLGYAIRDWRHLTITTSLLGTPFMLIWWFVPESTRWLLTRGRLEEADDILRRITKFNKRPLTFEKDTLERLREVADADQRQKEFERRYSYMDLFRTRKYIKKSCLLVITW